jgi:hypothetical protein
LLKGLLKLVGPSDNLAQMLDPRKQSLLVFQIKGLWSWS